MISSPSASLRVRTTWIFLPANEARSCQGEAPTEPLAGRESEAEPSQPAGGALPHPERIGPYRILQVLGEGGMGTVYEAEQTETVTRRVALKVVKLGMDTRDVVARFDNERQALAVMDHPGIARVLDAGATPEGRPYFVMEYFPGRSMTRFADEENLNVDERLRHVDTGAGAVALLIRTRLGQEAVVDAGIAGGKPRPGTGTTVENVRPATTHAPR